MIILPDPPPVTYDEVLDWYNDTTVFLNKAPAVITSQERLELISKRDELMVLCQLTADFRYAEKMHALQSLDDHYPEPEFGF